jgi:hypothetical protein
MPAWLTDQRNFRAEIRSAQPIEINGYARYCPDLSGPALPVPAICARQRLPKTALSEIADRSDHAYLNHCPIRKAPS